jgi:hypothetical protein
MSDSDNSNDFGGKSIDSEENNNNKINNNINNDKNQISNNNDQDDEFKIENNEINEPNKNENDSLIEIKNKNLSNNNDTNINKEKKNNLTDERKVISLNDGNSLSSLQINRKKDVILIEIDEEKSSRNKYTVYQLIELKNNSNFNINNIDPKNQDNEKSILCFRRYSDFDKFYNTLKVRYPHCIFPRLSLKGFKFNEDKTFLENRRKELQYFINRLYFHEEISKSEEFKHFINSVFDPQYYDNLPKKYSYPECEKVNNEKGYFSLGVNKLKGFFGNTKVHNQSENEREILKREEEFKNKVTKYNELLKEIKNLYESAEETKKEYKIISNNFLYVKGDNNKDNEKDEDNCKNIFNELIDLNQNISKIYEDNTKNYLMDIMDQLNYCILDVEGINRAIERFNNFIKEYEKVNNTKNANKYVSIEKSKIEKDKDEFERILLNDLKKYDKENEQIYELIIQKLIFYIHKINEEELKAFNNTSFN